MSIRTPRTDAKVTEDHGSLWRFAGAMCDFARQLERELTSTSAMLARQCDLARQAETERDAAKRELTAANARIAELTAALMGEG